MASIIDELFSKPTETAIMCTHVPEQDAEKTIQIHTRSEDGASVQPSVERADDESIVDFEENDPSNPKNWSLLRKYSIILLVSVMLMVDTFATTSIVPAAPQVLKEFHVTKEVYEVFLVSIWELGEGIGSFVYGPLSEIYGRLPIYHVGNILFFLCLTGCALSKNMAMLIVFRFLSGCTVTSLTLGPSIVGDVFEREERGTAMAINIVLPIIGIVAAPISGSFTAQAKGWRWTIWIVVIAAGALTLLSFAFFRETYEVTIIGKKCARLRRSTENPQVRSKYQELTSRENIVQTMTRPIKMLIMSPVVLIISVYTALAYGTNYLVFTTLTEVMENTYGFGQGIVGLAFLPTTIGSMIGMVLYAQTSDRYLKRKKEKDGASKPEHRLPLMLVGAVVFPVALFAYGWTAEKHVHWIAPLVCSGGISLSLVLAILPTENYLVDIYNIHGASAVASGVILRALFGAWYPLVSAPLYGNLGLGWGNSVLGFISMAFASAVWLLIVYGESIRKRGVVFN